MRKLILSNHLSLDGFVAGPQGEMNWIKLDHEQFDMVGTFTDAADTAVYARVTYDMMDNYWPAAAGKPNASKHDHQHSAWYNSVDKIVLSNSKAGTKKDKTSFYGPDFVSKVEELKKEPGKDMLIFGSPHAVYLLMEKNLIDDYWLFINPVMLGKGIPFFPKLDQEIPLKKIATVDFSCGVTGLHYGVQR